MRAVLSSAASRRVNEGNQSQRCCKNLFHDRVERERIAAGNTSSDSPLSLIIVLIAFFFVLFALVVSADYFAIRSEFDAYLFAAFVNHGFVVTALFSQRTIVPPLASASAAFCTAAGTSEGVDLPLFLPPRKALSRRRASGPWLLRLLERCVSFFLFLYGL